MVITVIVIIMIIIIMMYNGNTDNKHKDINNGNIHFYNS